MSHAARLSGFGLASLSLASGSTDVMAFLKLGDVFTSGMTGNVALLGIAISRGHMLAASHSLLALLGFVVGAAVTTALYNPDLEKRHTTSGLRPLFGLEIACLGGFALLWNLTSNPEEGYVLTLLILLSAIGMGIQGVVARNLNTSGISTIVFTSTLINIVISVTNDLVRPGSPAAPSPNIKPQLGTFAAYALGAVLAGLLISHNLTVFVWVPVMAVFAALGCSEAGHDHPTVG
jgi:uncharacterized membrane protein YoaK (UPF0700 family)